MFCVIYLVFDKNLVILYGNLKRFYLVYIYFYELVISRLNIFLKKIRRFKILVMLKESLVGILVWG